MEIKVTEIAKRLNLVSWEILEMISAGISTYAELKEKLNISHEKVTKEITRLEGGLLVRSQRNDMDTRLINLNITEYGIEALHIKKKGRGC